MKKTILVLLILVLATAGLSAQQKLVFAGGGYIEHHLNYEYEYVNGSGLPLEDFSDTWQSWGIGSTQFIQGPKKLGYYHTTMLTFIENLERDPGSSYQFSDFRLGLFNITGVGMNLGKDRFGVVIGGGIHVDAFYFNKYPGTTDSNYWMLNLGLGGGGHLYFMITEQIGIHAGTTWWWDPFQIRTSSSGSISDDYTFGDGWGYNITGGVTFKL